MSDAPVAPIVSPTETAKEPVVPAESKATAKEAIAVAAEATKRKFKVKVDGEEREVDEDEIVRDYQTSRAAQKRFQEASEIRKTAEELFEILQKDPLKALKHPRINADVKKMAEAILAEELDNELLSPTEKELRQLKREIAERDEKIAKAEKERTDSQIAKAQEHYQAQFTNMVKESFKISGLPKNKVTINRMIDYVEEILDNKMEITPKQIAKMAKEDYEKDVRALFSDASPEALLSLLGEDSLKKVRMLDIAKLKKPGEPVVPTGDEKPPTEKEPKQKRRLTAKEIFGK